MFVLMFLVSLLSASWGYGFPLLFNVYKRENKEVSWFRKDFLGYFFRFWF